MDKRTLVEARTEAYLFLLDELRVEPAPSVKVTSGSESYYNMEKKKVVLGIGDLEDHPELLTCVRALLSHELGHYFYTTSVKELYRERKKKGEPTPPFSLLNILEDARIEKRMTQEKGVDSSLFTTLHRACYETYYWIGEAPRNNPINIGVLLRWKRWGVETQTEKPEELTEEEYEEFLNDWEEAIEKSEDARDTQEVFHIALSLYLKWRKLFDSCGSAGYYSPEAGEGEEDEEVRRRMEGEAEDKDEEEKKEGEKRGTEEDDCSPLKDIPLFSEETDWEWDEELLKREANILKRYLRKEEERTSYSTSGKRISPRKLSLPTTEIFKRKETILKDKPRILMIIDHSGSMMGHPISQARNLARIVEEAGVSSLDVIACSTEYCHRIKNTRSLPSLFPMSGEGFIQFKGKIPPPPAYDLVFLVTDLYINKNSFDALLECRRMYGERMIGVYVGESSDFNHEKAEALGIPFIVKEDLNGLSRLVGLRVVRAMKTKTP